MSTVLVGMLVVGALFSVFGLCLLLVARRSQTREIAGALVFFGVVLMLGAMWMSREFPEKPVTSHKSRSLRDRDSFYIVAILVNM
jgi:hypothetical protein